MYSQCHSTSTDLEHTVVHLALGVHQRGVRLSGPDAKLQAEPLLGGVQQLPLGVGRPREGHRSFWGRVDVVGLDFNEGSKVGCVSNKVCVSL